MSPEGCHIEDFMHVNGPFTALVFCRSCAQLTHNGLSCKFVVVHQLRGSRLKHENITTKLA